MTIPGIDLHTHTTASDGSLSPTELIGRAAQLQLGAIAIAPIHPNARAPAHRILVAGVKGARGPLALRPAIILHDLTGAFTPFIEALHRGEALIDWRDPPRRPHSREKS